MITVTGATGHIGNVLIRELLSRGKAVRALVLPSEDLISLQGLNVELVEGNICNPDSVIRAFQGSETVYHLAGIISITSRNNEVLRQVNVVGTQNVIEACRQTGVKRLVYTSSIHAVKEPPHGTTIDESSPYDPDRVLGYYAKSKARATLEVIKATRQGLDAVIVCPTGVIGPYDYRISEMGQLIINLVTGKLKAYIDGAYDFVDVRDAVNGLILACEKGRSGESYILSGKQVAVREIIATLKEITGRKAPSVRIPISFARPAGVLAEVYYLILRQKPLFTAYSVDVLASNSVVSSEKARRELGFSSRPFKESIADAVKWFKENGRL